jgi:hypothetical protein
VNATVKVLFVVTLMGSATRAEAFEFRHLLSPEFPELDGARRDASTSMGQAGERPLWMSYKRWIRLLKASENLEAIVRNDPACLESQNNFSAIRMRLAQKKRLFEERCFSGDPARACQGEALSLEGAESALADLADASRNCLMSDSWESASFEVIDEQASLTALVGLGVQRHERIFVGPHLLLSAVQPIEGLTLQSRLQADFGLENEAIVGAGTGDLRLLSNADQLEWSVGPRVRWQQGFLKEDQSLQVYFVKAGMQVDVLPVWNHYESNFQYSIDYSTSTDAVYRGLEHNAGYAGPIYLVTGIQGLSYRLSGNFYQPLGASLFRNHQAIALGVEYTSLLSGGGSGSLIVMGEERRDSEGRANLFPRLSLELKSRPQKIWTWRVMSGDWGPESFQAALKIYNQSESDFLSSSVQKIGFDATVNWSWTQFIIKLKALAERRQYRAAPVADRKDQILALQVEWAYFVGEHFQISVPLGTRIQNVLTQGSIDPALFSYPESTKVINSFGLKVSYRF